MTLRGIEGGGDNPRNELRALLDDGVAPIVKAMRDAVDRGQYEHVVQHADDLSAAADAVRASAMSAGGSPPAAS